MRKTICNFEIILFVLATVAFSWIISESNTNDNLVNNGESWLVKELREILLIGFGGNLVSAQEGVYTCVLDKNGSRCQEYPYTTCNSLCASECLPTSRENTNECKLGTCIDAQEGLCSANSPRGLCESQNGLWDSRASSEVPMCRFGCCVLGTESKLTTSRQCDVLRDRLGASAVFKPEITNEVACIALARPNEEGACVLGESDVELGKFGCKFSTRSECLSLRGTFNAGVLCSNTALNTTCVKQSRTSCVNGKDEVYWMDSCGNRENIYDANKVKSWNDGKILQKIDSCDLKLGNDFVGRQSSCGNCNYLLGSQCGVPRAGVDDDLADKTKGNFVCRDLSCKDENNQVRKNGESWCNYDGQIGARGVSGTNAQRAVDVAGSEHYKKVCLNGEITTEVCGPARSYVCSETRDEKADFSQAACRVNQWQKCMEVSAKFAQSGSDGKAPDSSILNECTKYTDCFIKTVDVDSKFKFSLCVPKYPPGFASGELESDTAQSVCNLGTQTCTYAKKKGGLFGGGSTTNKNCREEVFTETMNNLCMSLGDCGAKVNVAGEYTDDGIKTKNAKDLSSNYIGDLKKLANSIRGQKAESLSEEEVAGLFGYDISDPNYKASKLGDSLGMVGLGGLGAVASYYFLVQGGSWAAIQSGAAFFGAKTTFLSVHSLAPTQSVAYLGPFGNAVVGALVGAAAAYFVGKLFGLEGNALRDLIIVGAVAGFVNGLWVTSSFVSGGYTAAAAIGAFLIWTIVIIIVFAVISKILGWGKVTKKKIEFQCLPWQAPIGGANCGKCDAGENGLSCTQYKCKSLGQACNFINEGTSEEACVNVAANDVTSPVITPNNNFIQQGYRYSSVSGQGFKFEGPNSGGCLPTFSSSVIAINTNERAFCKFDNKRTSSFDDMPGFFHSINGLGSSAKRLNHTLIFSPFSNEFLIQEENESADFGEQFDENLLKPASDGRVNLYVRCQDVNGNTNDAEYNINFCVSPEPDRTPPVITQFTPSSPAFSALGASEKNVVFYTNEPAECKWSDSDTDYSIMANEATCANDLADGNIFGWACNATLPLSFDSGTGVSEKNFYFRCKDQPWLNITINGTGANGETRNVNQQSSSYIVKKTINPLIITSVSPNNTIIFTNGLPADINLSVTTSGGSSNGASVCEYKWGQSFINFFISGTNLHKQNLKLFEERNYSIDLVCEDEAGNTAEALSMFNVDVDSEGPMITRAYYQNGLTIITNENSMCAFSLNSCSFSFANGTSLAGNERVHTTSFLNNSAHYVICRDVFENVGSCVSVGRGIL